LTVQADKCTGHRWPSSVPFVEPAWDWGSCCCSTSPWAMSGVKNHHYNLSSWLVMSVLNANTCDYACPWVASWWSHSCVHVHWTNPSASCLEWIFCADIENCQTKVVTILVCSFIIRVNYWMNCCYHCICSHGYHSTWVVSLCHIIWSTA
jgi:hypothetical protein